MNPLCIFQLLPNVPSKPFFVHPNKIFKKPTERYKYKCIYNSVNKEITYDKKELEILNTSENDIFKKKGGKLTVICLKI